MKKNKGWKAVKPERVKAVMECRKTSPSFERGRLSYIFMATTNQPPRGVAG
jgi:hypothetical protein